jgi:hypothetical protein
MSIIPHIAKLAFDRNYRNLKNLCLVSGKKLLQDLNKHHTFEDILVLDQIYKKFFSQATAAVAEVTAPGETPITGFPLISINTPTPIDTRLLQRLSQAKEVQGIFAVASVKLPAPSSLVEAETALLAFDSSLFSVSEEPQTQRLANVATILRSAVAFNFHSANFCDKSPDLFSPEIVRASQGALWTLPYRHTSLAALLAHAERAKLASVQIITSSEGAGLTANSRETVNNVKTVMKGKRGVLLLVTAKPRREFITLATQMSAAPFQICVSAALYDVARCLDGNKT